MPRPAHPWFRQGRSMWYVTFQGKQTPLGISDPNAEAAAKAAHEKLVADTAAEVVRSFSKPSVQSATVAEAIAGFRAHLARRGAAGRVSAKTIRDYGYALTPFCVEFGIRLITSLTAEEVEEWAERPGWSMSTRNSYLGTIQTLLKWAKVPLKIERPAKESRGATAVLTDEQFAEVLTAASPRGDYPGDFREFLRMLRETGARPSEIARLTAEMIDWPNAQARLKDHKTRRHTGRDRVLVFSAAALEILRPLKEKYGSGLLFRTRAGKSFKPATIVRQCQTLSERVGFHVIAYGCRHSFATRALAAGVPDAIVGELLGHRGTAMITAHYSHLAQQSRTLRDAAERVSRAAG